MQLPSVDPANLFRLIHFFDIVAAVVFAVSGALVASRKRLDVMGFMWLAVITGVGGGTVRDVILNVPVFWVQNPAHVSACLVTAVVMHFVAPRVESRYRTLLWFDAFGLALVTVAGTVKRPPANRRSANVGRAKGLASRRTFAPSAPLVALVAVSAPNSLLGLTALVRLLRLAYIVHFAEAAPRGAFGIGAGFRTTHQISFCLWARTFC